MSSAGLVAPHPPSGPGHRSRHRLSPDQVAESALALIERDGVDRLSMRRLAQELGVGTMTLYGYFRDKEALLDAVVDLAAARIKIPPAARGWKAQLRELMEEIRLSLGEHPVGIILRMRRPMWSPGALRVSEAGLQVLREAGFGKADAARAYRSLFNYTFGFVAFSPAHVSDELKRTARAALAVLPPGEYPAQIEAATDLAEAIGGEAQFRYGLELLLDGLELKLKRRSGGR